MDLVEINNGVPTTTSLAVAKKFGKRHERVLDAIKKLVHQLPTDTQHNFVLAGRMTNHRLANWLLAACICVAMGSLYHLDGPSEIQAAIDTAKARTVAAREEQTRDRLERSARKACGENAHFQLLDASTVQCFTKRGLRTSKVAF